MHCPGLAVIGQDGMGTTVLIPPMRRSSGEIQKKSREHAPNAPTKRKKQKGASRDLNAGPFAIFFITSQG
jgi:hypothetical protein